MNTAVIVDHLNDPGPAGILKRHTVANLVNRINHVEIYRISMIQSAYGKFAALRCFILPAPG